MHARIETKPFLCTVPQTVGVRAEMPTLYGYFQNL
jgi:hypothetical protein